MSDTWTTSWRWSQAHIGWFVHSRAFTAFVAYQRQNRDGGPPAAASGAAEARRFAVAIAGPWRELGAGGQGRVERYVLRGSLDEVRPKLIAALERRQHQFDQQEEVPDAA